MTFPSPLSLILSVGILVVYAQTQTGREKSIHFNQALWRKSGSLALFAVLALLATIVLTIRASAQRVITLDAPGADITAGSNNGTFATSINDRGTITGYYIDTNDVAHGFVRTPKGMFTTFEAPGADTTPGSYNGTAPIVINNREEITGSYYDANGISHGFLRSPEGEFVTFDVPGAGGYGSVPQALNREGAIVGYYSDANYLTHAFLRRPDGTFKTWVGPGSCTGGNPAGCYGSAAFNINAFGTIAGGYEDNSGNFVNHDYVRSPGGGITTFDAPGAGTGLYQGSGCPGCSAGLNQWGAIAATYIDANSVQHGFLRSPDGKFTTFDAPGAGTGSYQGTGCPNDCPVSLNDFGAITGIYIDANGVPHGYLRSPKGKFTTIDGPGSIATVFVNINDVGIITGYYIDANYVWHGYIWVPKSE